MKKWSIYLVMMALIAGVLTGCGNHKKQDEPKNGKKNEMIEEEMPLVEDDSQPAVTDENDIAAETESSYMRVDGLYGLSYEVPEYMTYSEGGTSMENYYNFDGNPVSYITCEVNSGVSPDPDMKDMFELEPGDITYESFGGDEENGYKYTGHYVFLTDKTNAGTHEMQVIMSVTGATEQIAVEECERLMRSIDFSEFYFDNFAE